MKFRRVLVVFKKSSFDVYAVERRDRHFLKLVEKKHRMIERFISSHETHYESLETVRGILKRLGFQTHYTYRADSFSEKGFDLVLTVGGDGTFLEASHRVVRAPMLGLNSSPKDSVGMFCGVTAGSLEWAFDRLQAGKLPMVRLTRLAIRVGARRIPNYALNDVLIAHANPAATSRYILGFRGRHVEQRSSGLWVAPPAGATAAVSSAGGSWLPIRSKSFQFVVRELYVQPGTRPILRKGIVQPNGRLVIHSKMRNGRIYLDGPHLSEEFHIGQTVVVTSKAPPLEVYAFNVERREIFR